MTTMRVRVRIVQVLLALALSAPAGAAARTILFVGNSFTFGATSPVQRYRPELVHDLNGEHIGGVPALFKTMTGEAGLRYDVSLETIPGADLGRHLAEKGPLILRRWDAVVLQSYSTLNRREPGNPAELVRDAGRLSEALKAINPQARIFLTATWSRADLTYERAGPWRGKPIFAMALDIRDGYDRARAAAAGRIEGILPVGQAWNLAIRESIADPDPYDGIAPGQIDLWGPDHYHASSCGYYLEALVAFGAITGRDPRRLGGREKAAAALNIAPPLVRALQQVANETLQNTK
jgi:hypothetical protein